MRNFTIFSILVIAILLTACSKTDEPNIISESPNEDLKAAFALDDNIYTMEGQQVLAKDVGEKIGEIKAATGKIAKNGDAKRYDSSISLRAGATIFNVKEQDQDKVVAVKIGDTYYDAIFHSQLHDFITQEGK